MKRSLLLLPVAALSLGAQAQPNAGAITAATKKVQPKPAEAKKGLAVGDPAPAFKVSRWVKGTPVTTLEKGKVYVVEFWATWCGPCRETIPHLTELAKKLEGKATFIGVDVWERGSDEAAIDKKVDEFVQEMGDKMGYGVCRDGVDKHMANAWMQAAGQNGIPAAFIVDPEGRIAHVGHPMNEAFEKTLNEVIAGTFDLKASQAAFEKQAAEKKAAEEKRQAVRKASAEVMPAIQEARKAKDWAKVLKLAQEAETKYPDLKATLKSSRFAALAATDAPKAQALLDEDLKTPSLPALMNTALLILGTPDLDKSWAQQSVELMDKAAALEPKMAGRILPYRFGALLKADEAKAKALFDAEKNGPAAVDLAEAISEAEGLDKAWQEQAIGILEPAAKGPKATPFTHQALASAYFKAGRAKEAVASQETFLALVKKDGAPPAFLKNVETELAKYQAAAK